MKIKKSMLLFASTILLSAPEVSLNTLHNSDNVVKAASTTKVTFKKGYWPDAFIKNFGMATAMSKSDKKEAAYTRTAISFDKKTGSLKFFSVYYDKNGKTIHTKNGMDLGYKDDISTTVDYCAYVGNNTYYLSNSKNSKIIFKVKTSSKSKVVYMQTINQNGTPYEGSETLRFKLYHSKKSFVNGVGF